MVAATPRSGDGSEGVPGRAVAARRGLYSAAGGGETRRERGDRRGKGLEPELDGPGQEGLLEGAMNEGEVKTSASPELARESKRGGRKKDLFAL